MHACSPKATTYGNAGVIVYRERSRLKVELAAPNFLSSESPEDAKIVF